MRFYFDENLSDEIAEMAREHGLDALSSHEVGQNDRPDAEQLAYAISLNRCVVTFDQKDFLRLAQQLIEQHVVHFGILVLPRSLAPHPRNYARIVRALEGYARMYPEDIGHTDWLQIFESE